MQPGITNKAFAVVHLVWLPFGIELFRSFVASYQAHNPGCDHDLVIVFNGVSKEADTAVYHAHLVECGIRYSSYILSSGQDITAYRWAASQLDHTYLLFLNSYCRLLAGNWGACYLNAIRTDNAGAVSATGSWQSYYSSVFTMNRWGWEKSKTFHENFRKYKLFVKAAMYWRFLFRAFPNPHLRTNAFIIKRELFLSIACPPLRNKFAAYLFESGKNGLSGELLRRGYELLVVDRNGVIYKKNEWKASATFWIKAQENLLVSDNRTRMYDEAGQDEKAVMTRLAWGL